MPQGENKPVNAEQVIIAEFIKDLENTANQVQQLLTEIRDSKVDFATVRTELKFVVDNVKQLSHIVRDGDGSGSVLTRLALIEQSLLEIREEVKDYISKDTESGVALSTKVALLEQKVTDISTYIEGLRAKDEAKKKSEAARSAADQAGKWKLYVTIAGGVFTLLGSIIALVMSMWGK